jgi:hypothetical protein
MKTTHCKISHTKKKIRSIREQTDILVHGFAKTRTFATFVADAPKNLKIVNPANFKKSALSQSNDKRNLNKVS